MAILHKTHATAMKSSYARGVVFGLAQGVPMFAWTTAMWYGGYLVKNEGLSFAGLMK